MLFLEQLFFLALFLVGVLIAVLLAFYLLCLAITGLEKLGKAVKAYLQSTHAEKRQRRSIVRYSHLKPARQARRLSEVAAFTKAVMQLQANNVLSAQEKLGRIARQYVASLDRLRATGELTPQVEAELRRLAETSADAIIGLTANFGRSLIYLVAAFPGKLMLLSLRRLSVALRSLL